VTSISRKVVKLAFNSLFKYWKSTLYRLCMFTPWLTPQNCLLPAPPLRSLHLRLLKWKNIH
jgi:hypothetical protein